MNTHSMTFTTHEGTQKIVPIETIRLIKPLSDTDKEKARTNLTSKGITIDTDRLSARIEFADKSSKLIREDVNALRAQGIALVDLGGERFVPAANITSAERVSEADVARLTNVKDTFHSKVQTRGGGVLLSAHAPQQVMDRRANALSLA